MDFRELALIVLVAAVASGVVWFESGRDRAVVLTASALLSAFAILGAAAVLLT